jgi:hypothetical protein
MTIYDAEVDGPLSPHPRHAQRQGPKTHAFVVGVGYYHHLPGGDGKQVKESMDLEQLTSPPASARAFTKWVLGELSNPDAPIGSVELLTSPAENILLPNGVARTSGRAQMALIREAFDRWYGRANSHPDNVALFYFCGHGVQRHNVALLAEDYGSIALAPFQTAIDLNRTWDGMARCAAQTQCYFIDACRQAAWAVQDNQEEPAVTLIEGRRTWSERDAPRFMATGPGKSAYGMTDGITAFTEVLTTCLKRGARKINGRWKVTTTRLSEALTDAMKEVSRNHPDRPQYASPEGPIKGNTIHELDSPPDVPVYLTCDPAEATEHARLMMRWYRPPHSPTFTREVARSERWELLAPAGHYTAEASFSAGHRYRSNACDVWADPPGPVHESLTVI